MTSSRKARIVFAYNGYGGKLGDHHLKAKGIEGHIEIHKIASNIYHTRECSMGDF